MKKLPFNLQKALAGDRVVNGDDIEVFDITYSDKIDGPFKVTGIINGDWETFTEDGSYRTDIESKYDLYMKQKTRTINGFEVPEPVRDPLEDGQEYFVSDLSLNDMFFDSCWDGGDIDFRRLERGLIHLDEESAIANANAMMGIDPYES